MSQSFPGRPRPSAEADPDLIRAHTVAVTLPCLDDLRLHVVTPDCPWWRAEPADLLATYGVDDPFWAFCWPGGLGLGRYLLDHPELVWGRKVWDIGAGSGVAGLAALRAGAAAVTVNDVDPWALAASRVNADLNGLALGYDGRDWIGGRPPDCDVLLLGDVSYSKELVERLGRWLDAPELRGVEVLLADPGRGFLPRELTPRAVVRVPGELGGAGEDWVEVGIHDRL